MSRCHEAYDANSGMSTWLEARGQKKASALGMQYGRIGRQDAECSKSYKVPYDANPVQNAVKF